MRRPQLQSTFARATVPVAAGIGFFGLLFAALWGVAALVAHNGADTTERLTPAFQEMGRLDSIALAIAQGGPIILPDLVGNDRHVVLDHTGDDDLRSWSLHLAHPADRDSSCAIQQIERTRQFTDCDGRTLEVADLAEPPQGVSPIINRKAGTLTLSLRETPATPSTTPTS